MVLWIPQLGQDKVRRAPFSFFTGIASNPCPSCKSLEMVGQQGWFSSQRTITEDKSTGGDMDIWMGTETGEGRGDQTAKGFLCPQPSSFLCLSGPWVIRLSVFLLESVACWSWIGLDSNIVWASGESASGTRLRHRASFQKGGTSSHSMCNRVTRQSCGEGDLAAAGRSTTIPIRPLGQEALCSC